MLCIDRLHLHVPKTCPACGKAGCQLPIRITPAPLPSPLLVRSDTASDFLPQSYNSFMPKLEPFQRVTSELEALQTNTNLSHFEPL